MARFGTFATVQWTICRYDQTNKEKIDDVENGDTPHDLLRSSWNFLLWVGGFRGSQSSQFSASVRESCSDEHAAETVEPVEECGVWGVPIRPTLDDCSYWQKFADNLIPVSCTNVASVVRWYATAIDDDTENQKTQASNDLDHTEDEFDLSRWTKIRHIFSRRVFRWISYLAITSHSEELNGNQSSEQGDNPSTVVDTSRSWPVVNDVTGSRDFEGQDRQPTDGVFPSTCETKRGIDEATDVHREGSIDRIDDRHFCQSLHHEVAKSFPSVCGTNRLRSCDQTYTMPPRKRVSLSRATPHRRPRRTEASTYPRS